MNARFDKDDIVVVKDGIQMPFKVPSRRGIVRFAYDHDPLAYEVEFYWRGSSLGKHYLTHEELEPFTLSSELLG
jgi:hypothetical protein